MEQTGLRSKNTFWLIVIGAAFWGVNPLFRVMLLDTLTSAQIVFIEHILLAFITVPILWMNRRELKGLKKSHIGALLFISWGGSALATLLFTAALTYAGSINAVLLLQKMQPLFAIILARIILKELFPKHFAILVSVALIGTYFLTFGFSLPLGHFDEVIQMGSILSLAAAALWGGSTVMGRHLLKQMKFETVTSLRFVLAIPFITLIMLIQNAAWALPTDSTAMTLIGVNLLISALLPGLFSMLLYYKGLTNTKASVATLAELSFPMTGMLVNWLVFQESVTAAQFTGFVLIWVVLFTISKQKEVIAPISNEKAPLLSKTS
ncbi:DMT family transporter [Alkalicoccobacillus murimartini]|uniref:Drug/metabolite transporter (DMT)-like permease n=1 Tax=Alkalicoccobacillus murimartini TaxID=171685 RepID=A0ABT9YHP9_9BACI|nr:DMT family transporter [Alkalicoccobacillus murimartini]MDQ0206727.1 drug/metabolite transporter (DMT)-like permease [Alkalicoccobacillus murimartini]